jgi:cytochrome c biogenesis protein CcmG/thiol:disulfide interchange protein DsbE
MRALKFLIPLALFAGIAWFLLKGLDNDPRNIPSPLIDKPAPAVSLPRMDDPSQRWTTEQMRGQVWVLNVWGSWCAGCRVEHPLLEVFSRQGSVPIVGLAWKDDPKASKAWLDRLGDPYKINVMDREGRAAIDWGVYGAPETFVIDKAGVVRDKHTGPLTRKAIDERLVPLIKKLQAQ